MNDDEILEDLILKGAVEFVGLDEYGQPLFSFTEKIFEVDPNLAYHISEAFHNDIMALWELGHLSMDVTQENPKVSLTSLANDRDSIHNLPDHLRVTLNVIKDALRKEE